MFCCMLLLHDVDCESPNSSGEVSQLVGVLLMEWVPDGVGLWDQGWKNAKAMQDFHGKCYPPAEYWKRDDRQNESLEIISCA